MNNPQVFRLFVWSDPEPETVTDSTGNYGGGPAPIRTVRSGAGAGATASHGQAQRCDTGSHGPEPGTAQETGTAQEPGMAATDRSHGPEPRPGTGA